MNKETPTVITSRVLYPSGWTEFTFSDGAVLVLNESGRIPRTSALKQPISTYRKLLEEKA